MLVVHVLGALGLAGTTAAQPLQIATPVLYTCQASALAYTCDRGPCTVFIRPSDDPSTILQSFAGRETGSGSVTYIPGATAGLSITAFIYDSTGNVASNAPTQVFSGLTGCGSGSSAGGSESGGNGGTGGHDSGGVRGGATASARPSARPSSTTNSAPSHTSNDSSSTSAAKPATSDSGSPATSTPTASSTDPAAGTTKSTAPIDSNDTSPPIRASAAGPSLKSTWHSTLRASVIITTLVLFVSH